MYGIMLGRMLYELRGRMLRDMRRDVLRFCVGMRRREKRNERNIEEIMG